MFELFSGVKTESVLVCQSINRTKTKLICVDRIGHLSLTEVMPNLEIVKKCYISRFYGKPSGEK